MNDPEDLRRLIKNTPGLNEYLKSRPPDNPINTLLDCFTDFYGIPWDDIDIESFEAAFHQIQQREKMNETIKKQTATGLLAAILIGLIVGGIMYCIIAGC